MAYTPWIKWRDCFFDTKAAEIYRCSCALKYFNTEARNDTELKHFIQRLISLTLVDLLSVCVCVCECRTDRKRIEISEMGQETVRTRKDNYSFATLR
jgi:hypothetical protein